MRLAILGGSFDPVHVGHLALAEAAAASGYDRVLLIPSSTSPHKASAFESAEDRLALLSAAVAGSRALSVDDCELLRGGVSYTIDTVADVARRYLPEGRIGVLLGDDLVAGFPSWRRAADLAEEAELVLARRLPDGAAPFPYPHRALPNALVRASSSEVRAAARSGADWRRLVPPAVAREIEARGLYGVPRSAELPAAPSSSADAFVRVEERAAAWLGPRRFMHARSVALLARDLCVRHGLDPERGYLAGIGHDLCKELPAGRLRDLAGRDGRGFDELESAKPSLLHARAAAVLMREEFGIVDEGVLEAVRLHTSADAGMGDLAKLVYAADKIEPLRPDVRDGLRALAARASLEDLFAAVLRDTAAYLAKRGRAVSAAASRALAEVGGRVGS